MSETTYDDCTPAERTAAIEQLGRLIASTQAELLSLIVAADRAEDWREDGATGMAPWLVGTLGVSAATAHQWVEAAHELEALPELRQTFAEGRASWEQIRPATKLASPSTDALFAREVPGMSARQLEAQARQARVRRPDEERGAVKARFFRWRADPAAGGYRYSGFEPTDRGARLNNVVTRMAECAGPNADTGLWDPFEVRAADALADLAEARAADDADPDACLVVVHVDAEVVTEAAEGNGTIDEVPVSAETARRMLCDCKVEHSIDAPDGTTVGIGRASRTVPRWLRRRIAHRDGVCRFPGCGRQIRHRHHIRHWTKAGPTDADNLIGLCWHHHHLVHEGGWEIQGNPEHEVEFVSPYGRRWSSRPASVRGDVRQRAFAAAGVA